MTQNIIPFLYYSIVISLSSGALIDEANELFEELEQVTLNASNYAVLQLSDEPHSLDEFGNKIVDNYTLQVQYTIDDVYQTLSYIRNSANSSDRVVPFCLGLYEVNLTVTLQNNLLSIVPCVADNVYYASINVKDTLASINNVVEGVYVIQRQLQKCDETNNTCLFEVIDTIQRAMTTIPTRIYQETSNCEVYLDYYRHLIEDCGVSAENDSVSYIIEIIDLIRYCIVNGGIIDGV